MQTDWISQAETARRLGVSRRIVRGLIEARKVRTRELPGFRLQLSGEDVARLERESIREPEPAQAG